MNNRILEFLPREWQPRRLRERVESLPDMQHWIAKTEAYVAEHPGTCLAAAFAAGVAVAWWIKRK